MFTLQSGQLLASAHALSAFSRSGSAIAQGLRSTWNQGLEQLYGRAFEIAAATLTRRLAVGSTHIGQPTTSLIFSP